MSIKILSPLLSLRVAIISCHVTQLGDRCNFLMSFKKLHPVRKTKAFWLFTISVNMLSVINHRKCGDFPSHLASMEERCFIRIACVVVIIINLSGCCI